MWVGTHSKGGGDKHRGVLCEGPHLLEGYEDKHGEPEKKCVARLPFLVVISVLALQDTHEWFQIRNLVRK